MNKQQLVDKITNTLTDNGFALLSYKEGRMVDVIINVCWSMYSKKKGFFAGFIIGAIVSSITLIMFLLTY